jgi:thiamine biosynthesis protein ThiS
MFRRMGATISITVNGEAREIPHPATVAGLLAQIGLDLRKVAVERNLEIVHFIGGG